MSVDPPRAPEGCTCAVTISCLLPLPHPTPTPTVTSASEYAHRGLDKLEENLPILQQPPEKVTNRLHEGRGREDAPLRLGAYLGRGVCGLSLTHSRQM